MILLVDIGNTHTHVGLGDRRRVRKTFNLKTSGWADRSNLAALESYAAQARLTGACFCSVVPDASVGAAMALRMLAGEKVVQLTSGNIRGIRIDYPRPETIGQDRLANAVAVRHHFGAPAVVVDFGTAVTFDVVDRSGAYVGGIIAPGLAAMTDYLHEKTALLPKIQIREPRGAIGKNTKQAMLIGAVHGYRGLVDSLIAGLKSTLRTRNLPVVATGGYAEIIARRLPAITSVRPEFTLEGLRLTAMEYGLAD